MKKFTVKEDSDYKMEMRGSLSKFWVTLDGENFIFKMPHKDYPYTSFAEVLFSSICKNIGIDCVDVQFAKCDFMPEHTRLEGILVRSFLENDNQYFLDFCDILEELKAETKNLKKITGNYNAESLALVINEYAKFNGYKISKNIKEECVLRAITDYFLMSEDRQLSNVGMIDENYSLKLAPIFDNGESLCLCNTLSEIRGMMIQMRQDSIFDNNLGCKFGIFNQKVENDFFQSKSMKKNLFIEVVDACKKSRNAQKLVETFLQLDMAKEICKVEYEAGYNLPTEYSNCLVACFNRKKQLLLAYDKTSGANLFRNLKQDLGAEK